MELFSFLRICAVASLLLLGGCAGSTPTSSNEGDSEQTADSSSGNISYSTVSANDEIRRGEPDYRPVREADYQAVEAPTGSLFDANHAVDLFQRNHNYRVGDMILVQLDEKTSSNKSLNYKADKSDSFQLDPVTVNAGSIQVGGDDLSADFQQENQFDSSAESEQKNSLRGNITVYVLEVFMNGNLKVAGEKWITLNKGEEFIRFSGEIRSQDVSAENTISSFKVGNAKIEFSGKGDLQENQTKSIFSKFFSLLN